MLLGRRSVGIELKNCLRWPAMFMDAWGLSKLTDRERWGSVSSRPLQHWSCIHLQCTWCIRSALVLSCDVGYSAGAGVCTSWSNVEYGVCLYGRVCLGLCSMCIWLWCAWRLRVVARHVQEFRGWDWRTVVVFLQLLWFFIASGWRLWQASGTALLSLCNTILRRLCSSKLRFAWL